MVRRFGFYMGVALLCSVSLPAFAGFEFIAPIDQEPVKVAPRSTPTPAPVSSTPVLESSEIEPLLPLMPVKDKKIAVDPLPVLPKKMVEKPADLLMIEKGLPPQVMKKAVVDSAPSSMPSKYSVVEGFASQVPLVIALQQVIPAQYQYAFADGVNPGVMVDWQGGKPWDQIVGDMVADQGMVVDVSGNVAYIRRQGSVSAVQKADMAPKKEMLARSGPVPLLPSDTASARVVAPVENSLLFDSPQHAQLSGVAAATPGIQPKQGLASKRLELSDLSIGQPMNIMSLDQKKKSGKVSAPKTIVKNKKILTAPANATVAPLVPSLPPATALAPIEDKKNLLLDSAPRETRSIDLKEAITPIEKMPEAEKVAMSEAMMSIMKQSVSTASVADVSQWQASSGETLRSVLERWAEEAETSLIWESNYDYPFETDVEISGTFEKAVATVLDGLSQANPRPLGRLHRNEPAGVPVLVIETDTLTN